MSTHFPSWNHCSLFRARRICKICKIFHCQYTIILIADGDQYTCNIGIHEELPIRYIYVKTMKGQLGHSVGGAPAELHSPSLPNHQLRQGDTQQKLRSYTVFVDGIPIC